ncbi:MAG: hypothetical protein DRJ52_11365 [Thermoprotei archaeon]|nr:MAG: hypothetical protein DRJ52_11365 [Thermoprotei archaeon]
MPTVVIHENLIKRICNELKKSYEYGGVIFGVKERDHVKYLMAYFPPQPKAGYTCVFDSKAVLISRRALDEAYEIYEVPLLEMDWIHTHPNIGAFFSKIDRDTLKEIAVYKKNIIGIVVDPFRYEIKAFTILDGQIKEIPVKIEDFTIDEKFYNAIPFVHHNIYINTIRKYGALKEFHITTPYEIRVVKSIPAVRREEGIKDLGELKEYIDIKLNELREEIRKYKEELLQTIIRVNIEL